MDIALQSKKCEEEMITLATRMKEDSFRFKVLSAQKKKWDKMHKEAKEIVSGKPEAGK